MSATHRKHKTISVREESYLELVDIAGWLTMRDKRPVSLCEAFEWVVRSVPRIRVEKPKGELVGK